MGKNNLVFLFLLEFELKISSWLSMYAYWPLNYNADNTYTKQTGEKEETNNNHHKFIPGKKYKNCSIPTLIKTLKEFIEYKLSKSWIFFHLITNIFQ